MLLCVSLNLDAYQLIGQTTKKCDFVSVAVIIRSHCFYGCPLLFCFFFPSIPCQVFEVKHFDPSCIWVATTDGPISDKWGLPLLFCCSVSFPSSLSPTEMKRTVLDPHDLKSKLTLLLPDSRGARGDTKIGPRAAFRFKGLYHFQKLTTVTSSRADCLWLSSCPFLSIGGLSIFADTC